MLIHQDPEFCNALRPAWSVYFSLMDEITPTTPTTTPSPDWPKNTAFPPPDTKAKQLDDGTIRVGVGDFWTIANSWSEVDRAETLLIRAYRDYFSTPID